jgi:Sigma-70 region 2
MSTQSEPGDGRLDPSLSAIVSERLQLINLAYRLLGSLADAEDVAQGTYARWYAMFQQQEEAIASQPAADEGGKSHLPRCARFGAGLAVELLGECISRAAAGSYEIPLAPALVGEIRRRGRNIQGRRG